MLHEKFFLIAFLGLLSTPALARVAPAGAQATGCNVSASELVRGDRTGEILYWTNSTCSGARSGSDVPMMMDGGVMMGDQMMGGGVMDRGMMGDS